MPATAADPYASIAQPASQAPPADDPYASIAQPAQAATPPPSAPDMQLKGLGGWLQQNFSNPAAPADRPAWETARGLIGAAAQPVATLLDWAGTYRPGPLDIARYKQQHPEVTDDEQAKQAMIQEDLKTTTGKWGKHLADAAKWLRTDIDPSTPWEKVGAIGEQLLEFIGPAEMAKLSRGAEVLGGMGKAAEVGDRATQTLNTLKNTQQTITTLKNNKIIAGLTGIGLKALRDAGLMGAQSYAHTGDPGEAGKAAALGGVFGTGAGALDVGGRYLMDIAPVDVTRLGETFPVMRQQLNERGAIEQGNVTNIAPALAKKQQAALPGMMRNAARRATANALDIVNKTRQAITPVQDVSRLLPAPEGSQDFIFSLETPGEEGQTGAMAQSAAKVPGRAAFKEPQYTTSSAPTREGLNADQQLIRKVRGMSEEDLDAMSEEDRTKYMEAAQRERTRGKNAGETPGDNDWRYSDSPILQHEAEGTTYQSRDTGNGIVVRALDKDGNKIGEVVLAPTGEGGKLAYTTGPQVPEQMQRKGIGTKLYSQLPAIAKAYGIERIVGEGAQNEAGQALWKGLQDRGLAGPITGFDGEQQLGMITAGAADIHRPIQTPTEGQMGADILSAKPPGARGDVTQAGVAQTTDPHEAVQWMKGLDDQINSPEFSERPEAEQNAIKARRQQLSQQLKIYYSSPYTRRFGAENIPNILERVHDFGDAEAQLEHVAQPVFQRMDAASTSEQYPGGEFSHWRDRIKAAQRIIQTSSSPEAVDTAMAREAEGNAKIMDLIDRNRDRVGMDDYIAAKNTWRQASRLGELHARIERMMNGITPEEVTEFGKTRMMKAGNTEALDEYLRDDTNRAQLEELLGRDGISNLKDITDLFHSAPNNRAAREVGNNVVDYMWHRGLLSKLAYITGGSGLGTLTGHTLEATSAAALGVEGTRYFLRYAMTNPTVGNMLRAAVGKGIPPRIYAPLIARVIAEQSGLMTPPKQEEGAGEQPAEEQK